MVRICLKLSGIDENDILCDQSISPIATLWQNIHMLCALDAAGEASLVTSSRVMRQYRQKRCGMQKRGEINRI